MTNHVRIFISKGGSRRRRQWIKLVSGVDRNKANGYAIEGDFLDAGRQYDVPAGSVIYEYLQGDGRVLIAKDGATSEGDTNVKTFADWIRHPEKMPEILDRIEDALAARDGIDARVAAIAEIKRLMRQHDITTDELR